MYLIRDLNLEMTTQKKTKTLSKDKQLAKLYERTTPEGDCLIWDGHISKRGVPMVYQSYGSVNVRKVFSELLGKADNIKQEGVWVCKCTTYGCVAPAHTIFRSKKAQAKFIAKQAGKDAGLMRQKALKMASKAKRKIPISELKLIVTDDTPAPIVAKQYGVNPSVITRHRRNKEAVLSLQSVWGPLFQLGK